MRTVKDDVSGYSLVPDENGALPTKRSLVWPSPACRRFLWPLVVVLSFCAGITIGALALRPITPYAAQMSQQSDAEPAPGKAPAFGHVTRTFSYNRTFGADPSENELTNDAWDSIVPLGQGTVRLSDGPEVYTLSVMHQLHCLPESSPTFIPNLQWSIHQSFYTALHADSGEVGMQDFPHIRHCFDYIRQALICSADDTLEPVDLVLGGVTGWNGTHVCRDFGELTAWAEDHRTNNLRGFRQAHETHRHGGSS
ncbi:hypothetical protein NUW58_g2721 [Xylaria curta]|uniref:Uncharacterized protein n=1 Tax=Xylaria curta TaxID=42375 RepID=A0ACC1PE78_9PEZI|nr:hypothetical protein NUW58_g2721 [Xylaria curta]